MGRKQFWQLCTNRDCGGTGMRWIHAIVRIPHAKGSLIALNHRLRWLHSLIKYTGQTLQSAVEWLFSISCAPSSLSHIQEKPSFEHLCRLCRFRAVLPQHSLFKIMEGRSFLRKKPLERTGPWDSTGRTP
jgi:hypothetical protein